jgi:hypothetical protein
MNAEIDCRCDPDAIDSKLQWGRVLMNAERRSRSRPLIGPINWA